MQPDLEKAREALQAERLRLEELERAYALVEAHQKSLIADSSRTPKVVASGSRGTPSHKFHGLSKTETVKEAIKHSPVEFTLDHVEEAVLRMGMDDLAKRNDISFILSRLRQTGYLTVVKNGFGKIPSIYRVTTTESPQTDLGDLPLTQGDPP